MTIVAGYISTMRTVHPCCIIGSHYMAIHTCSRVIREIRVCSGSNECINKYAKKCTHYYYSGIFPASTWSDFIPKVSQYIHDLLTLKSFYIVSKENEKIIEKL